MRVGIRDAESLTTEQQAQLARAVMGRQAALSLRVGAVFVLIVFGVPVVNALFPTLANTPVLGFTATWLLLGVLFYPITWLLSAYFVRQSDRIEAECASLGNEMLAGMTGQLEVETHGMASAAGQNATEEAR